MSVPVVQVATIGKSSGSTTLASVLACAGVNFGVRVVLVELDPSGGDLVARLPARPWRRLGSFREQVDASELLSDQVDIGEYIVESFDGGPGLVIGDPYSVGVDARFGDGVLGSWVADAGWDCVIVDAGRWAPGSVRDDCELLYVCVDTVTAADLERAKRGCEAVRADLRDGVEMVVIVKDSGWSDRQTRDYLKSENGWRLTNVGPSRSVRKCWEWFRSGRWLDGREGRGFVRLAQFATPIAGLVERTKVGAGVDETLPGSDGAAGSGGLPLEWTSPYEGEVWSDFDES